MELFCEIILNFGQWFRRRCHFKKNPIWSSGGPPVQLSRTNFAILKEVIMRSIHVNVYMKFGLVVQEDMSFIDISYLELWQPNCLVD